MKVDMRARLAGAFAAGLTVVGVLAAEVPGAALAAPSDTPTYLLASVKTGGGQPRTPAAASMDYANASVSDDGRFTVFSSNARDMVPGDTNNSPDVFLRDSVNDVTTRISVASSGQEGTGDFPYGGESSGPSMSADGRYVVFNSSATNLVPDDTNGEADIFLRDVVAGVTTRVSLTENGTQIARGAVQAAISPNGRFLVFQTDGALVAGDTDSQSDLYRRDLETGRTVRVTETFDRQPIRIPEFAPGGFQRLAVTSDGDHVLFTTTAENLIPDDTNGRHDVFVRNVALGTTVRASVTDTGAQISHTFGASSMSDDGRYVAFHNGAANIVSGVESGPRVYVRDLVGGTTTLVSVQGNEPMYGDRPSISGDGRYVAFDSVTEGTLHFDIVVRDLWTRTTRLVSVPPAGGIANGNCLSPRFSANGHHLTFESKATNLVDGDFGHGEDIFVRLNVV